MTLAVVRDLRDARAVAGPDELDAFETDVLAGFVLARAAAGLSDGTISSDVIHNAGATLRWFVEDVWGQFGGDHMRPGVPLLPSERKDADGSAARVGDEALRAALAGAARAHLPDWPDVVTPHVLRHFCASQLYLGGMDLIAVQATLGHAWVATTMNYVHVPATHIEDAWIAGQQRAAERLKGLRR